MLVLADNCISALFISQKISAMKVYAHYHYNDLTGIGYRWRTLLQFGESWQILGSVVLKNPGSSHPVSDIIPPDALHALNAIDPTEKWHEFSSDPTINCVRLLFEKYYQHCHNQAKLDGVVQLFNLMNIMNPNLDAALMAAEKEQSPHFMTTDDDVRQLVAPVYLGWGNMGKDKRFANAAKLFFEAARQEHNQNYLNERFEENKYYHPLYMLGGRGMNKPMSKKLLEAFCKNTLPPR